MDVFLLIVLLFFLLLYFIEAFLTHSWKKPYFAFGLPFYAASLHNDRLFSDIGRAVGRFSENSQIQFACLSERLVLFREDSFLFGNKSLTFIRGKIVLKANPNRYVFVGYIPYSYLFFFFIPAYVVRYLGTNDLLPFLILAVVFLLVLFSFLMKFLNYYRIVLDLETYQPKAE